MRKGKIDHALDALNAAKGTSGLRALGRSYYADIKGDGSNRRSVWTIINADGGVTYSSLNGRTARETLRNIELATKGAA